MRISFMRVNVMQLTGRWTLEGFFPGGNNSGFSKGGKKGFPRAKSAMRVVGSFKLRYL